MESSGKRMLSNKLASSGKITVAESEKIITDDNEIANVLNDSFSNIFQTLNIPKEIIMNRILRMLKLY